MGANHSVGGKWENPAYDLDPSASRTATNAVSVSQRPHSRKGRTSSDAPCQTSSITSALQPAGRQVQADSGPASPASPAYSPAGAAQAAPAIPDHHFHPDLESPYRDASDGSSPQQDRAHIQHRVALRLLERKGADPGEPGRVAGSAAGHGAWHSDAAPLPQSGHTAPGRAAFASGSPSATGSVYATPSGTMPNSPAPSSGYHTPATLSPSSARRGENSVEADERMVLQAAAASEPEDGLSVAGPATSQTELIYRQSGNGLPGVSPWTAGGIAARSSAGQAPAMRGSDAGGRASCASKAAGTRNASASASAAMGSAAPIIGPRTVPPPPLLVLPAGGAAASSLSYASPGPAGSTTSPALPPTPAATPAGLAVAEGTQADPHGDRPSTGDRYRFTPRAWSAAGGRQELSLEEKEWLFGRPGGIGSLPPVVALGEGGEGLVDLVRLDLPGRTLHLARKATRTSVPSFALNGSGVGVAMLGITRNVAYRFPFEVFDREVRAMKAVKESGFVVRFQAAAYDHDKGQGFILMEAAQHGTLQDLLNALCRSAMHSASRQRAPLLQRAIAKFNASNAKASAPPSLAPPSTLVGNGGVGTGRQPQSLHPPSERPSRSSRPAGIGSCGAGRDLVELAPPDAEQDVTYGFMGGAAGNTAGTGCSDRFSCCSASSTVGSGGGAPEVERGGRSSAHAATAPASPGIGVVGLMGGDSDGPLGLMSSRALRYYGACMLQALVALHNAGYVYRDLKLSNVLVCEGGRVRLTDFGAAATCLPDQPGLFGGVAGTRLYLAPELLPWLDAPPPGEGSGKAGKGRGGAGGPAPYTVTVDSWTWGLVMVELATGWSIKELTQRVIRRVCHPRSPLPADLPPDCGLPPLLRQLLLEHVLVRDPAARWGADRIKTHPFFEGLDWQGLAEAEGPHAHLFVGDRHASNSAVDDNPSAVAAVMRNTPTAGGRRSGLVGGNATVVPSGGEPLQAGGSPVGGPGGYVMASQPQTSHVNAVTAFAGQRNSCGSRNSRPHTGTGVLPVPPMVLPPGSAASITGPTGAASAEAAAATAAAIAVLGCSGSRPHRLSGTGCLAAGPVGERRSSPGNVPLMGPVVMPIGSALGVLGSGSLGPRRLASGLGMSPASRLSTGTIPA